MSPFSSGGTNQEPATPGEDVQKTSESSKKRPKTSQKRPNTSAKAAPSGTQYYRLAINDDDETDWEPRKQNETWTKQNDRAND